MQIIIVNCTNSEGWEAGIESCPYLFNNFDEAWDFIQKDYKTQMEDKWNAVVEDESRIERKEDAEEVLSDTGSALAAVVQCPNKHLQYEMFSENV